MNTALTASITKLPEQLRKTLTWDRGKELSGTPVRAGDRDQGVLRRPALAVAAADEREHQRPVASVLPQGTDLSRWTAEDLEAVAHALNNRPRKDPFNNPVFLGWKTPAEVFTDQLRSLKHSIQHRCCIDYLNSAVAWDTANDAVLAEGKRALIDDPGRFDGVTAIGVDEHVWRHTRKGDKYVTVIIDLTGIRDGTGPARLLDMVEGRSKAAFKTWLADRPQAWRDAVEVVAMDGFTGFKTATAEELPDAVTVMDPFHVVRLAGDALDTCRRRVQQSSTATAAARPTRSTGPGGPCTPALTCSPTNRPSGSPPCSRQTSTCRSRRPGASTRR
jgi:hypothetical protein